MAYDEVLIRSAALVPCQENEKFSAFGRTAAKLYLLFDTGRLQQIQLDLDENMKFAVQGTMELEYGDSVLFPITGVKRFIGSTAKARNCNNIWRRRTVSRLPQIGQVAAIQVHCISNDCLYP